MKIKRTLSYISLIAPACSVLSSCSIFATKWHINKWNNDESCLESKGIIWRKGKWVDFIVDLNLYQNDIPSKTEFFMPWIIDDDVKENYAYYDDDENPEGFEFEYLPTIGSRWVINKTLDKSKSLHFKIHMNGTLELPRILKFRPYTKERNKQWN